VNAPLLRVADAVVVRGAREALRGASFAAEPGERIAVVGPNAAGKSTLLHAIAGHISVVRGEIVAAGRDVAETRPLELAREIALVPSPDGPGSALTVEESVALGRYPHLGPFRRLGAVDLGVVRAALAGTGVDALRGRRLDSLSAGERQRASVARGLAQEPRILLLDEPTAHLDVGHALDLFDALRAVAARGVLVLAVVHDLQQAAAWAGRIILLDEGRVAADGPPLSAMTAPALGRAFGIDVERGAPGAYAFTRRDPAKSN
jgi:iron complex transport system ATP-binding protein